MGLIYSRKKDDLKESCEHFGGSNGSKDMKSLEEKMQKLETEGTEHQKMEGRIEIEKCDETEKEDIYVPNWLIEILEWIKRVEMADSLLTTSSQAFEQICWPKLHGKVKPHRVPILFIYGEENDKLQHSRPIIKGRSGMGKGFEIEDFPIPLDAPPDYITGFDRIIICYLDEQLLQFFKCVAPKLKSCTFKFNDWTMDDGYKAQIHKLILLLADKMSMLHLEDFHEFDQLFPGVLNEIQCIAVSKNKYGFGPLLKWLTEKRIDGKQKILTLRWDWNWDEKILLTPYYLDRIKKEFSTSNLRSNFLIWQGRFEGALFKKENKKTGEILELYENKRGHRYLARYPKGEDHWKEEGERKAWPCDEDSTFIVVDNGVKEANKYFHGMSIRFLNTIKMGIEKILWNSKMVPPEDNMQLHSNIYNIVRIKDFYVKYQHVYIEFIKIIKEHLQTSIRTKIMESIGGDCFAETLNAIWNDYDSSMEAICSLDLDRDYVSLTGLLGIYELGMEIFGKEIVDHRPISEHLKAIFGEDLAMAKGKIDESLFEFLATRING